MPNFERNLKQTVTYWEPTGSDLFGKATFSSPVTLSCRWEDIQEQFTDKLGQVTISRSKVYLASDINIDGYLFLGTSVASDPTEVAEAEEIRNIKRIPDLYNLKTMYVAIV